MNTSSENAFGPWYPRPRSNDHYRLRRCIPTSANRSLWFHIVVMEYRSNYFLFIIIRHQQRFYDIATLGERSPWGVIGALWPHSTGIYGFRWSRALIRNDILVSRRRQDEGRERIKSSSRRSVPLDFPFPWAIFIQSISRNQING